MTGTRLLATRVTVIDARVTVQQSYGESIDKNDFKYVIYIFDQHLFRSRKAMVTDVTLPYQILSKHIRQYYCRSHIS